MIDNTFKILAVLYVTSATPLQLVYQLFTVSLLLLVPCNANNSVSIPYNRQQPAVAAR